MRKRANLMFACTIGTTLEWYDFFAFAACAVLVFDKQFFVVGNPLAATLLSLATFAVGFIARRHRVRHDRRPHRTAQDARCQPAVMGLSTFCVGLLPTYASIGLTAPLLLVLLRIVQGVAVGGEATGAILTSRTDTGMCFPPLSRRTPCPSGASYPCMFRAVTRAPPSCVQPRVRQMQPIPRRAAASRSQRSPEARR